MYKLWQHYNKVRVVVTNKHTRAQQYSDERTWDMDVKPEAVEAFNKAVDDIFNKDAKELQDHLIDIPERSTLTIETAIASRYFPIQVFFLTDKKKAEIANWIEATNKRHEGRYKEFAKAKRKRRK